MQRDFRKRHLEYWQNVSMRNAAAKMSIAEAGGINAVEPSVVKDSMGTPSVLERAFTTMWELGCSGKESG
jgi:hypothetical protein